MANPRRADEDGRRAPGAAVGRCCGRSGRHEAALRPLCGRSGLVFPSDRDKPLSPATMVGLLQRAEIGCTMHGFRSSFRVWAAEKSNATRDIAEMCLAHKVGSDIERSYARSDLFEKRRALMDAWAAYLTGARVLHAAS